MSDAATRERTALLAQVEAACKREADSRAAFLETRAEMAADAARTAVTANFGLSQYTGAPERCAIIEAAGRIAAALILADKEEQP